MGVLPSPMLSRERKQGGQSSMDFKQPDGAIEPDRLSQGLQLQANQRLITSLQGNASLRSKTKIPDVENMDSSTRTLYPVSIGGTPRSSADFYSTSNNSTETLISEYNNHEQGRMQTTPVHGRHGSWIGSMQSPKPDVLMMGYAQILGSYTLDGSLINQAPFEEAKRKGIVGGHGGGGVVRNEASKRDSGILGSLGWGNIGESLGGLLGANEISSIKEGQDSANAKAIPILSTPQAVLFVDLRLGPGESKSFTYNHPLPKGIPPSHKGRAIRVGYNLVIGTQRAATKLPQQHIQQAEIPFRVLTSVTGKYGIFAIFDDSLIELDQGDLLGHDLMSPHIVLSNMATISANEDRRNIVTSPDKSKSQRRETCAAANFASYIESLVTQAPRTSYQGLLSPTDTEGGVQRR